MDQDWKHAGYNWTVFEEVSKNLKNYDSMCNFEAKFNSLDETRGNLGTIVNMVKEDNPEEYHEWKMRRRPSLLLMSSNDEIVEKSDDEIQEMESDGENIETLGESNEADATTEDMSVQNETLGNIYIEIPNLIC